MGLTLFDAKVSPGNRGFLHEFKFLQTLEILLGFDPRLLFVQLRMIAVLGLYGQIIHSPHHHLLLHPHHSTKRYIVVLET